MNKTLLFIAGLLFFVLTNELVAQERVYSITSFGLKADSKKNASPVVAKALDKIKRDYKEGSNVVLKFPRGQYHFFESGSAVREYYISNHDQTNPKKVGAFIAPSINFQRVRSSD